MISQVRECDFISMLGYERIYLTFRKLHASSDLANTILS